MQRRPVRQIEANALVECISLLVPSSAFQLGSPIRDHRTALEITNGVLCGNHQTSSAASCGKAGRHETGTAGSMAEQLISFAGSESVARSSQACSSITSAVGGPAARSITWSRSRSQSTKLGRHGAIGYVSRGASVAMTCASTR